MLRLFFDGGYRLALRCPVDLRYYVEPSGDLLICYCVYVTERCCCGYVDCWLLPHVVLPFAPLRTLPLRTLLLPFGYVAHAG